MITIKEMISEKEMTNFVKFPFKLYKNNPFWVPPMVKGQLETFDKNINPVFEHASGRFFVAIKNKEIVGRIAVLLNQYDLDAGVKKVRFGWFDFIDDIEVSSLLLEKAKEIGDELSKLSIIKTVEPIETNIVIFQLNDDVNEKLFVTQLANKNILIISMGSKKLRMVTHLDYSDAMHNKFIDIITSMR